LLVLLGQRDQAMPNLARYLELQQPLEALKDWRDSKGFFGLIAPEGPERQYVTTALGYATETLNARPDDADARASAALANLQLNRFDNAFAVADPLPPPGPPRLRAVRGTVFLRRNDPERAGAEFDAALRVAPDNYLAAIGKARLLENQQRREQALAAFDHVLKIAVTDWQRFEGHAGHARVLVALGRLDEARQALGQARSLNTALAETLTRRLLP
jgi:tetratricopeptide (TPR) repeat protein